MFVDSARYRLIQDAITLAYELVGEIPGRSTETTRYYYSSLLLKYRLLYYSDIIS